MGPLIRAASLRGFVALVDELGGEPGALLTRFGIDEESLSDDDALVPITAHDLMLDAAASELRCSDLGLRLAQAQDLSVLGPLAVAIAASSTAREAVDCASRFLFVHSPALRVEIEDDPLGRRGVVALTYRKDLRESTYSPQGIELGLGVFYRVALSMVGDTRALRSVLIPHQPLSPVQRYVDYFGADVRFGGDVPALCVQRSVLEEGFADADHTIRAVIRAVAIDHLSRQFDDPRLHFAAKVRLGAAGALRTAPPTLESIARLFSLHPRTLQRRLADEDTSFALILDDVRREAAYRYLTTTDLPLGQVALMVGFREQSTLSRAARRWFGCSPRAVRGAATASAAVQGHGTTDPRQ